MATFRSDEIKDWCDTESDPEGTTALCARCGIDSVIGDASGYPIIKEFLEEMNEYGFLTPVPSTLDGVRPLHERFVSALLSKVRASGLWWR